MILSDISITRPVFASVLSLLLIAFGLVAFDRLPLREYPDIDAPVVSVETVYRGAAANVVESRITQVIEDRIAGVEGIRFIESVSEDGRSAITVRFSVDRDIDGAANDIRWQFECGRNFIQMPLLVQVFNIINRCIRKINYRGQFVFPGGAFNIGSQEPG